MLAIAKLFPAAERSDILTLNLVLKATPNHSSHEMQHLMILWQQYVEPDLKITCGLCFTRVLENFVNIQPLLIELEKESRLLDGE